MTLFRLRPRIHARWVWACLLCGILLSALQPFISSHFRQDGWEDEPAFRIRGTGDTVEYGPDDRPDHPADQETTMYVPQAASIDLPNAFQYGIDLLAALMVLVLPLCVALLLPRLMPARAFKLRAERYSGPAPPATPWRRLPPGTAPPSTT